MLSISENVLDDNNKLIMVHTSNDNDRTNIIRPDSHRLEFFICAENLDVLKSKSTNTFYL